MSQPTSKHAPTIVTTAACDTLGPQGQAYASLLSSSGVEVTEDVLPGVPHGFTMALEANVVKGFMDRQLQSYRAAFCQAQTSS